MIAKSVQFYNGVQLRNKKVTLYLRDEGTPGMSAHTNEQNKAEDYQQTP